MLFQVSRTNKIYDCQGDGHFSAKYQKVGHVPCFPTLVYLKTTQWKPWKYQWITMLHSSLTISYKQKNLYWKLTFLIGKSTMFNRKNTSSTHSASGFSNNIVMWMGLRGGSPFITLFLHHLRLPVGCSALLLEEDRSSSLELVVVFLFPTLRIGRTLQWKGERSCMT